MKQKEVTAVLDIQVYNPLDGIESYNSLLTISQVVKYFKNHNIHFTKTMIQNYVRIELLPPPINNRFYIREHLQMLVIIDFLKGVASLDEIKSIFYDNFENFSLIYEEFLNFQKIAANQLLNNENNFFQLITYSAFLKKAAQSCNMV